MQKNTKHLHWKLMLSIIMNKLVLSSPLQSQSINIAHFRLLLTIDFPKTQWSIAIQKITFWYLQYIELYLNIEMKQIKRYINDEGNDDQYHCNRNEFYIRHLQQTVNSWYFKTEGYFGTKLAFGKFFIFHCKLDPRKSKRYS